MQSCTGQTWGVGDHDTDDFYVFEREDMAKWFHECRTVHNMTYGSKPTDDGNFFMTELVSAYQTARY